jgi:hypothetical protein
MSCSRPESLTLKTLIVGNVLTLMPVVLMFAGLGLAGGAAFWTFAEDVPGGPSARLDPLVGGLVIALGVLVAIVSGTGACGTRRCSATGI